MKMTKLSRLFKATYNSCCDKCDSDSNFGYWSFREPDKLLCWDCYCKEFQYMNKIFDDSDKHLKFWSWL